MIKGEFDFIENLAKQNVCAKCKGRLNVVHHDTDPVWVLKCGECGYPEGLERMKTLTEESKIGDQIPLKVAKGYPAKRTQHDAASGNMRPGGDYTGMILSDLGTTNILSQSQVQMLIDYSQQYGLDAFRGHVCMMYDKPYIGLDGYLYHAKQTKRPFSLRSQPMNKAEYEAMHLAPEDHGWITTLTFLDTNAIFVGVGIVTRAEMDEKSGKKPDQLRSPVVAKHPWQLGQKRAEWQALRRGFPIGEGD